MASLEIHSSTDADSHKRFEILDEEISIGASSGSDIELPARADALARHARIAEHADDDYQVIALDGVVEVNGKAASRQVLEHGDLVRVGPVLLVFLVDGEPRPILPRSQLAGLGSAEPPPAGEGDSDSKPESVSKEAAQTALSDGAGDAAEPSAGIVIAPIRAVPQRRAAAGRQASVGGVVAPVSRSARVSRESGDRAQLPDSGHAMRTASGRSSARSPGGMPRWMFVSLALLLAIAFVSVTIRVLQANPERTPGDLLNLAEIRLARGEIAVARAYVDQAEKGELDDLVRRRIAEVRATIERVGSRQADQALLHAANGAFRQIHKFRVRYIDGKPPRREAAREFVAMSDRWLQEHRAVCSKYDDERLLVEDIEAAVDPQRSVAQMDSPDNAEDVLFRAGRRTRFKPSRNYREALKICDAWLIRNASDPRASEVRAKRTEWVESSVDWAERDLREIHNIAGRGAIDDALRRLRYLAEHASLPAWHDKVLAMLAEVEGLAN